MVESGAVEGSGAAAEDNDVSMVAQEEVLVNVEGGETGDSGETGELDDSVDGGNGGGGDGSIQPKLRRHR